MRDERHGSEARVSGEEDWLERSRPGGKTTDEKAEGAGSVRVLVRLDFSDHEKLSHQRWLDRIPNEEPFKSAEAETIRSGDAAHPKTVELFESLD